MPLLVVAVSGPSGSGKSTLAGLLEGCVGGLDVRALHQDDFFIGPKASTYWNCEDKDHPGAVDMERLRLAVRAARDEAADPTSECRLVLLEGFMLLQDEPILELCDVVIFIDAPRNVCLGRRVRRSVRTPREDEGCRHYYETVAWPGYLRYTEPALEALRQRQEAQEAAPRLIAIDGTLGIGEVRSADAPDRRTRRRPRHGPVVSRRALPNPSLPVRDTHPAAGPAPRALLARASLGGARRPRLHR